MKTVVCQIKRYLNGSSLSNPARDTLPARGAAAWATLMNPVCISRIAAATPPHDMHAAFVDYATHMLRDPRARSLLGHMAQRSGIEHRYSYLQTRGQTLPGSADAYALFRAGGFPPTAQRMELFEDSAPRLLHCALDRLALSEEERGSIRHILVTCCTGLYAPGLDFAAMDYLRLDPGTERTMIGFMGCYAAINALRVARHIVRSEPGANVLMINLELCSLHFQETQDIEKVLSFLIFGDGCAASLIRADTRGLALDSFRTLRVADTHDLITWRIGDSGFDMELSGKVPAALRHTLQAHVGEMNADATDLWAVHPGGRSILDAVEDGLALGRGRLADSRSVLHDYGNMSSATVMFVLERMMRTAQGGQQGCAMSFGPGLAAETMRFHVM